MPEAIPFVDLVAQYQSIRSEIDQAVQGVLASQKFILGETVATFEDNLKNWMELKSGGCVGVSSGTDALLASLMALGVGPGDEVLTTPFSFFATAGVIARLNAKPVFVDIDPKTFNLNEELLSEFDAKRFKAVIVVHLFGRCADVDRIRAWADPAGVAVVEDAAQAIGAKFFDGTHAGTKGSFGCFSFFPTKNLGGAGDGGCVVTTNNQLLDDLKRIRVHGALTKYENQVVGGNFRLDAIQAAILDAKLPHLHHWTKKKRSHASYYNQHLKELSLDHAIQLPEFDSESDHFAAHQYVIRCQKRDALKSHLAAQNIASAIYYPKPFHLLPAFAFLDYKPGDFPESESACQEALALPIFAEMNENQLERVVKAIHDFFAT